MFGTPLQRINHMTLTIALRGPDGIVLASDSRNTIGNVSNDTQVKLFQINDQCAVMFSGFTELAYFIIDSFLNGNKEKYIDKVALTFANHARSIYLSSYEKKPESPVLTFCLCGVEESNPHKPPKIKIYGTSTLDFPAVLYQDTCFQGSINTPLYLAKKYYRSDLSMSQLIRLITYMQTETASSDKTVGGPLRVATITAKDGFQEITPDEIADFTLQNSEYNKNINDMFWSE
jgi:20S proteasome alpha/beta subunit